MLYDVIVVGGGASGLVAAIFAARRGKRVAIVEHMDKIGKKILATGNGKCNYTNLVQNTGCYRGKRPAFAMEVLKQFDEKKTIAFFEELGIYPKVRNGYVYPYSEQATSVVEVLAIELKHRGVAIFFAEHVEMIKTEKDTFIVQTQKHSYKGKNVILATGGCASKVHGSDGSGYSLAKSFGHEIIPQIPALVQLKAEGKAFKMLAGVRVEGSGCIVADGNVLTKESGEFLFTNYGISGIPIFQMSRYAGEAIAKKKKTTCVLDFYPSIEKEELQSLMEERFLLGAHKTIEEVLIGFMNRKLAYVLLKEARLNPEDVASKVRKKEITAIVSACKRYEFTITGCNPFEQAQVSAGGVATDEVNENTLESKKKKGLYITGELLDIDGTCGGYNLQWAWATGAIAGQHV